MQTVFIFLYQERKILVRLEKCHIPSLVISNKKGTGIDEYTLDKKVDIQRTKRVQQTYRTIHKTRHTTH